MMLITAPLILFFMALIGMAAGRGVPPVRRIELSGRAFPRRDAGLDHPAAQPQPVPGADDPPHHWRFREATMRALRVAFSCRRSRSNYWRP
ncbi:MAG: hypothetical protein U0521_17820 [Anaerolineae bacterium]